MLLFSIARCASILYPRTGLIKLQPGLENFIIYIKKHINKTSALKQNITHARLHICDPLRLSRKKAPWSTRFEQTYAGGTACPPYTNSA